MDKFYNKNLNISKHESILFLAKIIYTLFIIILLGGGFYSWKTLKQIEKKLPISSLEQHNNISTMIYGLRRLHYSLILLTEKSDNSDIIEEAKINIDMCFNLQKNFKKTIPEFRYDDYVIVLREISENLEKIDIYFNEQDNYETTEILALYTSLDEIINELNSIYLDTNQQVINVLMSQRKQIDFFKTILLAIFFIIAIALLSIGFLFFLQKHIIKYLNLTELELKEAKKIAEESSQTKSNFLANMSHEIRTPMNAIIGLNQLLKKTELNKKQLDYINKIENASKNLLNLINDILDFSKIEAKKLDLEIIDFDLEEVLKNISNILSPKAFAKNLEFVIAKDSNIPQYLKGDPLRLEQVLINLVNNAIKFTEKGEVTIDISLDKIKNNTVSIKFVITDTGIGINSEQLGKLFESFYQGNTSTTRKYGGTGLGLVISQKIIEMFGGKIEVLSQSGKGSSFFFTANFGLSNQANENQSIPEHLKNMNVLIVDDNESVIKALNEYIKTFGMNTVLAKSGFEAIKSINDNIHLILMDYKMSDLCGLETWRQIKNKLYKIPKIILLINENDNLSKMEEGSVDKIIVKPIVQSTLFDSIVEIFCKNLSCKESLKNDLLELNIENIKGAKILVVEDNEINQQIIKETLEIEGFIVDIAENGQEAVNKISSNFYDVVLMDIQMPIKDGFTASKEIRLNKDFDTLPIIALTADAMSGTREKVLASGMNDYITKPINLNELYSSLLKWIKPHKREFLQTHRSEKSNNEEELFHKLYTFNVKDALNRLSGNVNLFVGILEKFEKSNRNFIKHIKDLSIKNDLDNIARELHKLKGVSSNLGEENIYQLVLKLEYEIENGKNILESENFKNLNEELLTVSKEISSLTKLSRFEKTHILDKELFLKLLKDLIKKLENYEISSLDIYYDLSYSIKEFGHENENLELSKYLENYNFEKALIICNSLYDKISKNIQN